MGADDRACSCHTHSFCGSLRFIIDPDCIVHGGSSEAERCRLAAVLRTLHGRILQDSREAPNPVERAVFERAAGRVEDLLRGRVR